MPQTCILDFLDGEPRQQHNDEPKFCDLFCGIGGASCGARDAGYSVYLAVDCWEEALEVHKKNHPLCTHICRMLPPTSPLPFPESGKWHLHGSPPCTLLSGAYNLRSECEVEEGLALVRWYIEFAINSNATTWSMEQVPAQAIIRVLEEYKVSGSNYRKKLDYVILRMDTIGLPQKRKRLIVGSPQLIAGIRRLDKVKRNVCDVIPNPKGTHIRNHTRYAWTSKRLRNGTKVRILKKYDMDNDLCWSIAGPSQTVVASYALRWATPGTDTKSFVLDNSDLAELQSFPRDYIFSAKKTMCRIQIGNAFPPMVARKMLTYQQHAQKPFTPYDRGSPSLVWTSPTT
jgi:DNA (cytosine-5)-methyltransferase 1